MTQPTPAKPTPEQEEALRLFSDMVQKMTPSVGDEVKIEMPDGNWWLVAHMVPVAEYRAQQEARRQQTNQSIRDMIALLLLVYGAGACIIPFLGPHAWKHYDRSLITLAFGIFGLALAAFVKWGKRRGRTE